MPEEDHKVMPMVADCQRLRGNPKGGMRIGRIVMAYLEECRVDLLRRARMPSFLLPTLLFPSMLYALFVCLLTNTHDPTSDLFWLANYASFAAMAPGLFAFGISTAYEAENGFAQFKRALPVPRYAYQVAKLTVSVLNSVVSVLLLILVASVSGHLVPPDGGAFRLILAVALGTLPFCALGLLIGSLAGGRSATGLVNLLLIPLAFFSGLLVPLQTLPAPLRGVAAFSPGHDLLALALASIKPDLPSAAFHAAYLVLFAIILGALAQWRLSTRN